MSGITVVFATRNGGRVLPEVLDGYARCAAPQAGWRMVVVDNGSTDTTLAILDSFLDRLPLTIQQREKPGKNGCLNQALDTADGDLVILTDDDAIPAPDFLLAWERMLAGCNDFDVFGGCIMPRFPSALPAILESNRAHFPELFAEIDLPEGEISSGQVFGPNMAVRRRVFAAGIRFDDGIGPNGAQKSYGMGSESEFCDRVARAGYRFWFNRQARVTHIVRPEQMTPDFVEGRAFRHGAGVAYRHAARKEPRSFGRRLPSRVKWLLKAAWHRRLPPPPHADQLWDHHWRSGYYSKMAELT